jgi:hypothetical protein
MRAWEMSIRRYSGLAFTTAAIVLGGYGIMVLVTPTEESLKAVIPFHPLSLTTETVTGGTEKVR